MAELDPDAEALIEELSEGVSPPGPALSIPTSRRLLDELLSVDDPEPVDAVTDLGIPGPEEEIPIRIYVPKGSAPFPVVTYLHGGGWARGSIEGFDGLCRALANDAGAIVISVGYRRAPEHPFPAAVDDCYAAVEWAVENAADIDGDPDRVAVAGDSAGGNLSAAVALLARDRGTPAIAHQTLIYPAVNPPSLRWFDSYDENGTGYLLEMENMQWYFDMYTPRATDARNAYAFPLQARDLSDLPPTTVVTAGFDPLRDEGQAYASRLEDAGVEVTTLHYDDQVHGFLVLYQYIDAGRDAIETVARDLADSLEAP